MKTKEEAKANLSASVAYIPARYEAGVKKADWAGPAGSDQAEDNFGVSMSRAVADKSRQAGVKEVSNEAWRSAAVTKGKPIIGERIKGALDKWGANWGPMYDEVAEKVRGLPPATTDWRANINERLVAVVETWKKAAGKE